jgi:hypothetical protein
LREGASSSEPGIAVDRRAYEVAVMMTLRDRLRSGDIRF